MLSPVELEDLNDEMDGPVLYASSCDSDESSDSRASRWSSSVDLDDEDFSPTLLASM